MPLPHQSWSCMSQQCHAVPLDAFRGATPASSGGSLTPPHEVPALGSSSVLGVAPLEPPAHPTLMENAHVPFPFGSLIPLPSPLPALASPSTWLFLHSLRLNTGPSLLFPDPVSLLGVLSSAPIAPICESIIGFYMG